METDKNLLRAIVMFFGGIDNVQYLCPRKIYAHLDKTMCPCNDQKKSAIWRFFLRRRFLTGKV
jgi:hypothetical protein